VRKIKEFMLLILHKKFFSARISRSKIRITLKVKFPFIKTDSYFVVGSIIDPREIYGNAHQKVTIKMKIDIVASKRPNNLIIFKVICKILEFKLLGDVQYSNVIDLKNQFDRMKIYYKNHNQEIFNQSFKTALEQTISQEFTDEANEQTERDKFDDVFPKN
jgi:hypothetical protein